MISHAHMLNPLRWVVEGVFMAQRHPLRFHTPCNPPVTVVGRISHSDDDGSDMGVRILVRVLVCRLACVHGNCAPAAQVVASR